MRSLLARSVMLAVAVSLVLIVGQSRVSEAAANPGGCVWTWETRPAPDLADQAQAALRSTGVAQAQVTALEHGERCADPQSGAVQRYVPMRTEYSIVVPVGRLGDKGNAGTLASSISGALASLPKRGAGPVQVRLTTTDGRATEKVQFSLDAVSRARDRGLTGAALLDAVTAQPAAPVPPETRRPGTGAAATQGETTTSYQMGVLVLKYFPLTPDGQNIDIGVTGDVDEPYTTIRQRTVDGTNYLLDALAKATTYLGHSRSGVEPALRYSIVETKEYTSGVPFTLPSRRPMYRQMMLDQNICTYVDTQGVREVWIWAYQGPTYPTTTDSNVAYLSIYESIMGSRFGDISNSNRDSNLPVCSNTYRVYTFNYNAGAAYAIHSWSHQIEAEMNAIDPVLFANKFQGPNHPQETHETGRCGSVHNPPNSRQEYDYVNPTPQSSDCLSWQPDALGPTTQISCSNWSCVSFSFQDEAHLRYLIWLWQNLPGIGNSKQYQGYQLRNFWDVHGSFDAAMSGTRTFRLGRLLTVSRAGSGTGAVTSSPAGITCGTDCTEAYANNTLVTLTASPGSGSTFGGWSGACSGTGICQVTMSAQKSVTATFTAAAGAADPRPEGPVQVSGDLYVGGQVTLTVAVKNYGGTETPSLRPYVEGTTSGGQSWRADASQPASAVIQPGQTQTFTLVQTLGSAGNWSSTGIYLWDISQGAPWQAQTVSGLSDPVSFSVGSLQCATQRPRVTLSTSRIDGDSMSVTVTAGAADQNNRLKAIRFVSSSRMPATNVTVSIPGQAAARAPTFEVPLPNRPAAFSFTLRRQSGGPVTVALEVTDGCGVWNTFVGFGS